MYTNIKSIALSLILFASSATGALNSYISQYAETQVALIPVPTAIVQQSNTEREISYVGNKKTKKFHYLDCYSVDKMNEKNKKFFYEREDCISQGYVPCKNCDP